MEHVANPSRRQILMGRIAPETPSDLDDRPVVAAIGSGCLPLAGVECQVCRDACPTDAIRFRPRRGGPFLPEIREGDCTGCGECAPACPAAAISMRTATESGDA